MTKYFEEYIHTDIDLLNSKSFKFKGELTIVISENGSNNNYLNLSESDKKLINKMINKISVKEIVSLICKDKKISKKEIYDYCLKVKNEK